jgi:hypothetical protein
MTEGRQPGLIERARRLAARARSGGRRTSLHGIAGPTQVSLRGTVAAQAATFSPVTGTSAALIHWTLFVLVPAEQGGPRAGDPPLVWLIKTLFSGTNWRGVENPPDERVYQPIEAGCYGSDLWLEVHGERLRVPLGASVGVRFAGALDYGAPLTQELPPELRHLQNRGGARGSQLYYRELCIVAGQEVTLRATVEPGGGNQVSPYRAGRDEAWVVRSDLEPVVIEDDTALRAPF